MSILVDIEKSFGSFLLQVRFEAKDETLALLGASGCGKSMTLKCIAGIEKPDRGRIAVDGVTLFDSERHIDLSPQERRVGLMFQNYALFPNMTVMQNIRAGAKRQKAGALRESAVHAVMERFGLSELASRYPHQLSGGQQQRVALARILISDPRILLLDEPFSALDSHLRFRLEQEVREVIRSFGRTVLLVSHDRDEVFRLADSVAVMNDGKIEVCGDKKSVFTAPKTKMAAMLTGCKNISRLTKLEEHWGYAADWGIRLWFPNEIGNAAYVGIRMHDLRKGGGQNTIRCRVTEEIENPFSVTVMLRPAEGGASAAIGWELDKNLWSALRTAEPEVCLPPQSLLLLEGDDYAESS